MKISIIVPVYKTGKYLKKCVNSIINQTFQDFELLLIDDGSPDNSGEICDSLALTDARIKVFHKENGGVATARNYGIHQAQGDWCMFVDSDDWIEDHNYVKSMSLLCTQETQLIISGFTYYIENQGFKPSPLIYNQKIINQAEYSEFVSKNLNSLPFVVIWAKLFKTSIIKKNGLYFDIKMRVVQDAPFLHKYLLLCNNISICDVNGYTFYIKAGNNSKFKLSAEQAKYQTTEVMKGLEDLQRKKNIYNALYFEYIPIYFTRLYCKYIFGNHLFFKETSENIKKVLDNKYLSNSLSHYFIFSYYKYLPTKVKLLFLHFSIRLIFKIKKYFI